MVPRTMSTYGSSPVPSRVLALLAEHAAAPLALVVAPAGYGKSIVLAHYAQSFPGQVIAWRPYRDTRGPVPLLDRLMRQLTGEGAGSGPAYGAGTPDTPPDGSAYVTGAAYGPGDVSAYRPGAADGPGDSSAYAPGAAYPPPRPHPTPTVESVLLAVERRTEPVLLLVDDVHLVHGNPVEAALEELALLAPANLRIALAGRRRPAINLARLELSGTVVVTARELAFDREEIRQALARFGAPGGSALAEELAALGRLTQGWPVALRLCGQVPRRAGARPGTLAEAVLASSAVRAYLDREVLGVLPAPLARDFERICRSAENGRWLTDDGSGVLEELDEGYGLVRRRGECRYDCVPLLYEHLRRRAGSSATEPSPAGSPSFGPPNPGPRPAAQPPAAGTAPGPRSSAYPPASPVTAAPPLSLRCFRRFEATVGDQVLDWRTTRPRVRALARLLAVHAGRPVHRERLMAALWPESPERTAGRGLQVAVSALRTFLEPGIDRGRTRILVRSGEAYMLSLPPGGTCDVHCFDTAVGTGLRAASHGLTDQAADSLSQALRLYTGELLPEDGPAEWVVPLREHYRAEAVRAAHTLAELELARDRPQSAVAAAHHALFIDPFQDAVWRLLVTAHRQAGDPVAAHHAELRHARMLDDLGVLPPGPATWTHPGDSPQRGLSGV
ncbi:AfsR/SARP family transcriptional regulator [Streptomyces sp.]|uniref:AfsR/SARP family transcriptional regulator n=1 Tax=Streptomyces sp. TaxID=1931 RepID=UPI002F4108BF